MATAFRVIYWTTALAVTVLAIAGCSQTNLAAILEAAAKDPATICGSAVYAGASVNFSRSNITNGDVDCNNGHMTIHSTPPAQPVGIQLVPMPSSLPR